MKELLRDGRGWTFAALFAGYAGYYVCRAVLPATTPLLLAEYGPFGVTKGAIGWVATAGTAAYMLGKIINGTLADRLGGRWLFVLGMVASALLTGAFALGRVRVGALTGVGLFALIWALNQYAQSAGWGALVQVVSARFPPGSHARVMGLLSMSFLLGNAAALACFGGLIRAGIGWRELFVLAALTLLVVAAGCALVLRREPPTLMPDTVVAGRVGVARQLARSPAFWLVCALSGGMTMLRTTFNFWSPTFLSEVAGLDLAQAAWGGAVFPVVGALSAALAGFASDRWRGRRGPVVTAALGGLTLVLTLMAVLPLTGRPALALTLVAAAAFFLTGPYTFCAGVMALDLGGRRGAATAAGLIDAAGYLCSLASGVGVGELADRAGWSTAFAALAAVALATAVAGLIYALFAEHRDPAVES